MSAPWSNDTNLTEESMFNQERIDHLVRVLKSFQALQIVFLFIELWIFVCMIVYGTKTGRWKKSAQTSSFNNGLIFIAGTVTLFLHIPKLATSLVTYTQTRVDEDSCEFVFDFATGTYTVASCGSYVFLWIRQRIIYNHPYVKPHVAKWVNWLSISTIILLTVNALGIGFTLISPKSYKVGLLGCTFEEDVEDPDKTPMDVTKISLLMFFLFVQLVIATLFVYPAKKVLFVHRRNENDGANSTVNGVQKQMENSKSPTWLTMLLCCGKSNASTSPIQMSVRRTMGCSFVMVFTDAVATILDISLDLSLIPPVTETIYGIVLVVHAVCIVMTFSFASTVFALFWPKCQKKVKLDTQKHKTRETDPEDTPDEVFPENEISSC